MGKIFGDVKGAKPLTKRQTLQNKYNSARANLLIAVVLTVVNIGILFIDSSYYFLFSIFVPYFIALMGMMITGKLPEEAYTDGLTETEFLGTPALIVMLVIAFVVLSLYLLSWIFSKKGRVGWLIFALVIFSLDTLLMLLLQGISESIIDIVFHILVIVYLSIGISSHYKLKNLPEEEITQETANETLEENQDAQVQNSPILRMADLDAKAKILLETQKDGFVITYRRVKRVNELVINGNVYDEYEALIENAHILVGKVNGKTIEAGFDGFKSYIKIDGEVIAKKVRLV